MFLSKQNLPLLTGTQKPEIPYSNLFNLPEKILQFGTGVLLRGLPDYFIDKANKQGIFNGRIVIVKSTSGGDIDTFQQQDNLFTQLVKGIKNEKIIDEVIINTSISRVLVAANHWNEILQCAAIPELKIIISNTTEAGIVLQDNDDINAAPPNSFPAKLLAFLMERHKKFNGSIESGMVIIPTELIPDNGIRLKEIILTLAGQHRLDEKFINWINVANEFCNSLVDRIVPGKSSAAEMQAAQKKLGYEDELMIVSEYYRLWAIETCSDKTKEILSFSKADKGVVLADDISKFREMKLRLLNGSHTFSCALALLLGFKTVKEATSDIIFFDFLTKLLLEEIVPVTVSEKITLDEANQFSLEVMDRFKNPFIEHQWINISAQYSLKMKYRCVPLLLRHYKNNNTLPQYMTLGFAAFLYFMKSTKNKSGEYINSNLSYSINDDNAAYFSTAWMPDNNTLFLNNVLQNENLWGARLDVLPGFEKAITAILVIIEQEGIAAALNKIQFVGMM